MNFLVRTEGDPARLAPTIRALAAGIDKEQPLSDFATFHEVVAKSVERPRFHVGILSAFGGLALLLAVIGVYGVLHYSVLEMRREIGIRIAIGATAWDILLMVLRRGMLQVAAGLIIGLGGCWALTRVLQSYLFETTPNDAATLASVAAAVTCAALAACIRPAWAATRIDPIVELRCE
ncbi:MAG TPA: FtsX-like permease family protein [Bryobacteraceae bacterium]|nr:FtsX-like permease family protein [Bryobacteraceae bacterium]